MHENGPDSPPRETAAMSVRGAAVWAMAGQYLSFAIQFVSSVIISRFFLTPEEVGLFSIAMAAALLVAVLQDFGLSRYISGLPSLDPEEIARCSSIALLFSLVVAGIIVALSLPMARLYAMPDLAPLLVIIGSSYLFLPLAVVPLALMARRMQFRAHFAVNVGGEVDGKRAHGRESGDADGDSGYEKEEAGAVAAAVAPGHFQDKGGHWNVRRWTLDILTL